MARTLTASPSVRITPFSAQFRRGLRAAAIAAVLAAMLALGLWQPIAAPRSDTAVRAAASLGGPELTALSHEPVAPSAADQAPIVYLVGSEPEAAWAQRRVADGIVRRELPPDTRVLVVGPDVDADRALVGLRDEPGQPSVQVIDLRRR